MARSQRRSARKSSGGRYHTAIKKKKRDLARPAALTMVGSTRKKIIRTRGGNTKIRLLSYKYANVSSQDGKTIEKLEIEDVEENPANRDFARRKILTKGAIIQTKKGKAKVTSRPGQNGVVDAVFV
ncbi:MAG: 30S ribosomal protein S8e [Candidatus Hodarchaeales archaeon]